ncbi:MAG: hypothetical protein AAF298_14105, partial [Cyanobacteria bacterium P01_A01_bin.40]
MNTSKTANLEYFSFYHADFMTDSSFTFYNPGKLVDDDLELILIKTISPETNPIDFVPVYKFEMRLSATVNKLGYIDFRVENT